MPWTEKQIGAAKVALACKRGEIKKAELNKGALSMYNSMNKSELEQFIAEGTLEDFISEGVKEE